MKKFKSDTVQNVQRWQLPTMNADPADIIHHEPDEENPLESSASKQTNNNVTTESEAAPDAVEQGEPEVEPLSEEQLQAMKDELREEIREQSYQDGFEKGLQDGQEQAKKEAEVLQRQLKQILTHLESPVLSANQEVFQHLEQLSVTLAQQLVRREIQNNPGEIVGLIRDSIKLLPSASRHIKITLNPEDAALVKDALSLDMNDEETKLNIIEDPMVTRGGCEIKSAESRINATLENRLASLAASVLSESRDQDNKGTQSAEDEQDAAEQTEAESEEKSVPDSEPTTASETKTAEQAHE